MQRAVGQARTRYARSAEEMLPRRSGHGSGTGLCLAQAVPSCGFRFDACEGVARADSGVISGS